MTRIAILVGFCRQMPDVRTFVLPTFLVEDGSYASQYDETRNGRVSAFRPIYTEVGFSTTRLEIGATIGNPMLYGFEFSDRVVIGQGHGLARYLDERLVSEGKYFSGIPKTVGAIKRFIEFTEKADRSSEQQYVFELVEHGQTGVYVPTAMKFPDENEGRVSPQSGYSELRSALSHRHDDQAGHHESKLILERLDGLQVDAFAFETLLGDELTRLLVGIHLCDGELRTQDDETLCSTCLFELLKKYPSAGALAPIVNLAQSLRRSASHIALEAIDIYGAAMTVAEQYFSRGGGARRFPQVYAQYIALREMEAGAIYTKSNDIEIGIAVDFNEFVESDEFENSFFEATLDRIEELIRKHNSPGDFGPEPAP